MPVIDDRSCLLKALSKASRSVHRLEICQLLEVGNDPLVALKKVILGSQGHQLPAIGAQGELHQPHVQVGAVVRDDNHLSVLGNEGPTGHLGLEQLPVEFSLPSSKGGAKGLYQGSRDLHRVPDILFHHDCRTRCRHQGLDIRHTLAG